VCFGELDAREMRLPVMPVLRRLIYGILLDDFFFLFCFLASVASLVFFFFFFFLCDSGGMHPVCLKTVV
jgi:hypothetical protein